jgi:hypothetical protein
MCLMFSEFSKEISKQTSVSFGLALLAGGEANLFSFFIFKAFQRESIYWPSCSFIKCYAYSCSLKRRRRRSELKADYIGAHCPPLALQRN